MASKSSPDVKNPETTATSVEKPLGDRPVPRGSDPKACTYTEEELKERVSQLKPDLLLYLKALRAAWAALETEQHLYASAEYDYRRISGEQPTEDVLRDATQTFAEKRAILLLTKANCDRLSVLIAQTVDEIRSAETILKSEYQKKSK